jgi:murein DD-endopeptidase MepM/ murein hydrolase activator NlpD
MDGVVAEIQHSRFAYGNAVIINHDGNLTSLYAHLSKIDVKEGQSITTLTKIGEMGATGHAFGDHLHLEIRKNGLPINPFSILPPL